MRIDYSRSVGQGIPESVRALVSERIESVAELEILLLLRERRERMWDAHDVAKELRTSAELAEAMLGRLSRSGLAAVEVDAEGRPCFRFAPVSPALQRASDEAAAAYSTHKTALIALIFSGPTDSIRGFADAFRVRSEDP